MPTHIRPACQNAQWPPYQNIIAIISQVRSADRTDSGQPSLSYTPWGQGLRSRQVVTQDPRRDGRRPCPLGVWLGHREMSGHEFASPRLTKESTIMERGLSTC